MSLLLAPTANIVHASQPDANAASTQRQPDLAPALATTISGALAALPNARDVNADQRKQAEELLRDALKDDNDASDAATTASGFGDAAERARETLRRAAVPPTAAAGAFADWRAKLPADASVDQLSEFLEQERNQLTGSQDALHAVESSLQKISDRPDTLRDELAAARTQADDGVSAALSGPKSLAVAATLRAQAAARLRRSRLAALETEQRTAEPRLRALFAERSEQRRRVDEHEKRVHLLENMLLDRTNSAVADLASTLVVTRDKLASAQVPLPQAAATNLDLGNDLVATVRRIGSLRDLKNKYAAERGDTDQSEKSTQARIELGGSSEEVGALLLAERRKLRPLVALRRELSSIRMELAQTKLSILDLRDEQDSLENIDAAIARALTQSGQIPVLSGPLHDQLQALMTTRTDLLTRLVSAKSRAVTLLVDAEQQLAGLTRRTGELFTLLDAHLLGTPSHAPISFGTLSDLSHVVSGLHPSALGGLLELRKAGITLPLIALLCLLAAVLFRARAAALFERVAEPMRRIRTDRFSFTIQVLMLTLLGALPIAVFWIVLGRIVQRSAQGEVIGAALAVACTAMAAPWFVLAFLNWLNRENGLAHLHFRWLRARRAALRHAAVGMTFAILIPLFLHTWMREMNNEDGDATIGRAAFMVGALAMASIAWRLLRPGGAWLQRAGGQVEPIRMRQFAQAAACSLFIALTVLAAMGYFFTATSLAEHVLASATALLAIAVLDGLAVRWLTLGERRLMLKRAEDRVLAERKARGEDGDGDSLPEIDVDEAAIADLGAQTRRVLRLAIWILVGASLLFVWSDIAPALTFLDKVHIWPISQTVVDGKVVEKFLTLRLLLKSLLILTITFIATRNLPGLLEIGVLRRIHLDAPTRYAITSVVRYLIVMVGAIVGIGFLGVQWSNLQWLAAGLTVGLGFGLQEIFANFISGLIVLFERPCRVGDVITIGNVEGTVMRIRTRATTIVDWDNKEVIVPNKNFITERLVNWTLSDTMTRVVIKIGIAYRNDPRVAQRLLIDIANGHDVVLKDPSPVAWMTGFGDSTLDFELRVFVAEINQRNVVRTELMMRIAETFAENDIEIAFTQHDVWLRTPVELKGGSAPSADDAQPAASAEEINPSKRA
ncbi:MAG: mechanosensitive ion channel domain-containing protein [Rudaea sp.]